MSRKYRVLLTDDERVQLNKLISSGEAPARNLTHARILLKADETDGSPAWPDKQISEAFDVSLPTIWRVRQRFVEKGLSDALHRRLPSKHPPKLLDGAAEAHLIAITCSNPPEGYDRWSLRLLADRMVKLEYVNHVSHETVRQTLKKTNSGLG